MRFESLPKILPKLSTGEAVNHLSSRHAREDLLSTVVRRGCSYGCACSTWHALVPFHFAGGVEIFTTAVAGKQIE